MKDIDYIIDPCGGCDCCEPYCPYPWSKETRLKIIIDGYLGFEDIKPQHEIEIIHEWHGHIEVSDESCSYQWDNGYHAFCCLVSAGLDDVAWGSAL